MHSWRCPDSFRWIKKIHQRWLREAKGLVQGHTASRKQTLARATGLGLLP